MEPSKAGYHSVSFITDHVDMGHNNAPTSRFARPSHWRVSEPMVVNVAGYTSVAIVPLTLAIWLPRNVSDFRHFDIFQSSPLGGSLTLNQAKAVDFVSSAVFAPLILAVFNYIWFANARVSIADERKTRIRGTSLYALVEASSISTGSYDLPRLWALCTSNSSRLMLFAVLCLAAAMGKSSLSNIIAYEAFKQPVNAAPAQLRLLTGPYMSSYDLNQTTGPITWLATHDQRKDFAQGSTEVLQGIAWQNSTTMLTSGAFMAFNVTSWGLSQLDSSTVALDSVPAIKGTIDCQPHAPTNVRFDLWTQTNNNGFTISLDTNQSATNSQGHPTGWSAEVPAPLTVFQDRDSSLTTSLDILAYSNDGSNTSIFVGSMGAVTGSERHNWIRNNTTPFSSPFGQIQAQPFHISENNTCPKGSNCTMLIWGIVCTVHQRQGLVNLTRASADLPWNWSSTSWETETQVRPSKLQSLSPELGTQSFKPGKAGLGPALTPAAETCNSTSPEPGNNTICSLPGPHHLNYQTLADNLLWAEMAVQTVAYETGAMNASLATPDMFITVPTTASVQRYRMTYIPALLFSGLICVFVAALLSASLLTSTANTASGSQYRYINSLRLLADCVANLHDEKLASQARSWSNDELEHWARSFMVRYETRPGLDGNLRSSTVLLTPVEKDTGRGNGLSPRIFDQDGRRYSVLGGSLVSDRSTASLRSDFTYQGAVGLLSADENRNRNHEVKPGYHDLA